MLGLIGGSSTTVAVQNTRLIPDEAIGDLKDTIVPNMILKNKAFYDAFTDAINKGAQVKFRQFFRYAEEKYPTSLMRSEYKWADNYQRAGRLEEYLASLTGDPGLEILYAHFGFLNPYHVAWQVLSNSYGYSDTTNTLTSLRDQYGTDVVLKKMTVVYPNKPEYVAADKGHLYWADFPPRVPIPGRLLDDNQTLQPEYRDITDTYVRVDLVYSTTDPITFIKTAHEFSINVPLGGLSETTMYLHVKYLSQGVVKYWLYSPEMSAADLGIDPNNPPPVYSGQDFTNPGRFYPVVSFYNAGQNIAHESQKETELYKLNEALTKTLGVSYADIGTAISGSENSDKIRQAVMELSVPVNSTDPVDIEYLYRFFDSAYEKLGLYEIPTDRAQQFEMEMVSRSTDYRYTIVFKSITKTTLTGSVNPLGHFSKEFSRIRADVLNVRGELEEAYDDVVILRHQILPNMYQEIRVTALYRFQVRILGSKGVASTPTEPSCLIPVDELVLKQMAFSKRDRLLKRSLRLIITAGERRDLEWYEGIFMEDFLKAVGHSLILYSFIVTVASAGTAAGPVAALLAAAGVSGVALTVLTIVIQMYLMDLISQELIRLVGPEWALIIAITLAVASIWVDSKGLLTSQDMLQLSNNLTTASNAVYQNEAGEIMKDYEVEIARQQGLWDELEEVRKLIEPNIAIDPFTFIGLVPETRLGEPPEDYFGRTIHAGNIGRMAFEQIHTYYDVMKRLPSPQETMTI